MTTQAPGNFAQIIQICELNQRFETENTYFVYYKNYAIWTFEKYCENKIYLENRWKRDSCDFIIEKKIGLGKYLELLELWLVGSSTIELISYDIDNSWHNNTTAKIGTTSKQHWGCLKATGPETPFARSKVKQVAAGGEATTSPTNQKTFLGTVRPNKGH